MPDSSSVKPTLSLFKFVIGNTRAEMVDVMKDAIPKLAPFGGVKEFVYRHCVYFADTAHITQLARICMVDSVTLAPLKIGHKRENAAYFAHAIIPFAAR